MAIGITVVVAVATLQSGPGHTDPGGRRSVHVVARLRPRDPGLCLAQQWRGTPGATARNVERIPIKLGSIKFPDPGPMIVGI